MTTLFQAKNRQGFLVNIDLEQPNIKEVLWDWLEFNHNDIYLDIELWEGGSIRLELDSTEIYITFSGDNGIFELVECEAESI